jgi:phosphatidylglycerol:prolipoprotein diacylglycerol transferase
MWTELPLFTIAQAVALLGAMALFRRQLRRYVTAEGGWSLVVASGIGAVLGALVLGVVLRAPRALLAGEPLLESGLFMAYGALFGAVGAAALSAKRAAKDLRAVLDCLAPALGVLVAVGRMGCFVAGCCFGGVTHSVLAISYPAGTPVHAHHASLGLVAADTSSLPVHPAQLYEAGVGIVMVVAGIVLAKRARRGASFAAVALAYAVGRFAVEFLRGDPRPMAGALSLPQWLSLVVVAVVLWLMGGDRSGELQAAQP